jgi:Ca2+-binding EF-hand superfamily protein
MNYRIASVGLLGLCIALAGSIARADDAKKAKKDLKPDEAAAKMIEKFDKNGDGKLDVKELTAALSEHEEAHEAKNGKTAKADAAVKHAEKAIKEFDKDGDGKLDASELEAMLKAHHDHKKPAAAATAT